MKLSTNIYQQLLGITAGASLLGIVGCSNVPGAASGTNAAMYEKTSAQTMDRILAYPRQGWDGGGGQGAAPGPGPAGSIGTAGSVGSSGGHSGGR